MWLRRWIVALLVVLAPLPSSPARAQPACTFTLGFKLLHDQIPGIIGDCLEDEHFEPSTGNTVQRTAGGLLVWRQADNWTAFTNGITTWINGPEGLAARPNAGPLFPWEAATPAAAAPAAAPPPVVVVVAPPEPSPEPASGLTPALASRCYQLAVDLVGLRPLPPGSGEIIANGIRAFNELCRQAATQYGVRGVDCFEWAFRKAGLVDILRVIGSV